MLSPVELEARLRAVQPAVCVLKLRHVREILRLADDAGEIVLKVPGNAAWVRTERVRGFDSYERGLRPSTGDWTLIVTEPDDTFSERFAIGRELQYYWRLLVRAAVVKHIHEKDWSLRDVRARFDRLGRTAETEIRFVLTADHHAVEEDDDRVVYRTFAAIYFDLIRFRPAFLPLVFPAIAVAEVLAEDAAFESFVQSNRPEDAVDPVREPSVLAMAFEPPPPFARSRSPEIYRRLATAAEAKGNHVRAAVIYIHSISDDGPAKPRALLRTGLLERMKPVLAWSAETTSAWDRALQPLIPYLAGGAWTRAARFLYELQKVPVDLEGEIGIVDPIEWAATLGRRPMRRTLTNARCVILLRHLKRAREHLVRIPLRPADRERIESLFQNELEVAEEKLRRELAPAIRGAFDEVGFRPANRVEEVAREKVVAELLDRLAGRGFLRFGDLRDAVARNQQKLPDLSPREWWTGDRLLQLDRRLAEALDGVYRGAEIYLRLIHRGTAAGFGTRVGRFLALYLLFPFLGAFLTVEFAKFLGHEATKIYGFARRQLPQKEPDEKALVDGIVRASQDAAAAVPNHDHGIALTTETLVAIGVLGLFFLALLHWPAFRVKVWFGLKQLGKAIHWIVVRGPRWIWTSGPVRAIRQIRVLKTMYRYFGSAIFAALLVALLATLFAASLTQTVEAAAIAFVVAFVVTVTPGGRQFEDVLYESLSDAWRTVRVNLIPGIISWFVWAFRALAGTFERGLYSVDELFRFRETQSRGSYGLKVVIAVVWFPIAYAFRFVFYLLVEPQVNPVKHFPIVTVSHKVIWPLLPEFANLVGSEWTAAAVINGIPGIFGFIAWELKEDWRLFAANRPDGLPRVVLGHHGETMRGLLRPGFHSGTVPAHFRKMRLALDKSEHSGKPPAIEKHLHGIDEVRHSIEVFVERELLPLVNGSAAWTGVTLHCHHVSIGVQSIVIVLELEDRSEPLHIAFERRDDAIGFRIVERGWYDRLNPERSAVLAAALVGFAEMGCANENGPRKSWAEWANEWERLSRGVAARDPLAEPNELPEPKHD